MRQNRLLITFITALFICTLSTHIKAQNKADYQSPQKIVLGCLSSISGDSGEARNWKQFKSYFRPKAVLIAVDTLVKGGNQQREFALDEFIKMGQTLEQHHFKEISLGEEIYHHNGICQVIQKYELSVKGRKETGVNLYTLVWINNRWWISHLVWSKSL